MDNASLNRFYEEYVKMTRDETKRNIEFVIPLVHDILQYVHAKDRRFKIQPLNVGSYYTHLKVSRADEFDYSVVLDTPKLRWASDNPHYYGFNEKNEVVEKHIALPDPPVGKGFISLSRLIQEWNEEGINDGSACLTIGEDIIPIKVKRRFKALVSEAVNETDFRNIVDTKKLSDSPATTLIVKHPRIAGNFISVDLAPLIESRVPFKKSFGWPRPGARWPSQTKIEEIKGIGINDIAKDPFYWTQSFASCEKELLDGIDNNGTIRKKSQRIMKKLKEKWCPKHLKQELTSYHLKNILFWECENYPYDSQWSNDQLATRMKSMCYLLIQDIQREHLPLYFHTGVNLFESKDKDVLHQVEANILDFLQNPLKYLK